MFEQDRIDQRCFEEGYAACLNDEDKYSNPYNSDEQWDEWSAWSRGWDMAYDECPWLH